MITPPNQKNEKDSLSDYAGWIDPAGDPQQQGQYAGPRYAQPQTYASRDAAPPGQYGPPPSYYPPPGAPHQSQYPPRGAPHLSQYSSQGLPGAPHQSRYSFQSPPGAPQQTQYSSQGPPPGYYPPEGDVKYDYDQKGHDQREPGPSGPSPSRMYTAYEAGPAPDGGAGPSSLQDQDGNKGGFMMSLASFFGPKGPPPMWQRQPPANFPYNAFPPMCLVSNSKELSKGFPEVPPPCQMRPHPFATHDITEEDWKRFLADVKKAGSLSPQQRIKSNVIPMATGVGIISSLFMTNAIAKRMNYNNRTVAGDAVDHWNYYFFGPRRLEVVLCQASERLSGKFGPAPVGDPNQVHMADKLRRGTESDDSSSDSSSSEDERRAHGHGILSDKRARRAVRREARHEKRERRRAKKTQRKEWRASGANEEPFQLFITAI